MSTPARRIPFWLSLVAALVAGPVMDLGFPDVGIWPLALLATALFLASLIDRTWWQGLLLGALTGAGFFAIHISWMTLYLGPVPWLALVFAMTLSWAAGGALLALVINTPLLREGAVLRVIVLPIAVAAVWTLREAVASTWPYGGFAWGRLSLSQSEGPFRELVSWVGLSGLSFLLVLVVMLVVQLVRWRGADLRIRIPVAVAVPVLLALVPAFATTEVGSIRVAAVQGDADAALDSTAPRGTILNNHIEATLPLLNEEVDVVVWPENAADLDPLRDQDAAQAITDLSVRMSAPFVLGTITVDGDEYFNSALLWSGQAGSIDQYDKIHPVPFAEYMPDRDFFHALAPDLVDLVVRDYAFGTRDPLFDLGTAVAGIAICYDTSDDVLMTGMVAQGAQVIFLPTNNADFGQTDQSAQQLAITRLRTLETGRAVVNISTVSASAIIDADGVDIASLEDFTPGSMVADVPLYEGITPAVAFGKTLEILLSILGALAAAAAVTAQALQRTRPDPVE